MKGKRHSPEQVIAKLREADALLATGPSIGQVCQKLAVSEQTFHRWRSACDQETAAMHRDLPPPLLKPA